MPSLNVTIGNSQLAITQTCLTSLIGLRHVQSCLTASFAIRGPSWTNCEAVACCQFCKEAIAAASCTFHECNPHLNLRAQGDEVIEDWEVWGDPREVERRKADRKRAAQPLSVRQAQVLSFLLKLCMMFSFFLCTKVCMSERAKNIAESDAHLTSLSHFLWAAVMLTVFKTLQQQAWCHPTVLGFASVMTIQCIMPTAHALSCRCEAA